MWFMVFNATFNNISVILWQSVLLMEETRVPEENHRLATSHWQTVIKKNTIEKKRFYLFMMWSCIYYRNVEF